MWIFQVGWSGSGHLKTTGPFKRLHKQMLNELPKELSFHTGRSGCMQGYLMQRLCCTRMSQATTAPSYPEPTPLFCNCSWQLRPFLLPEHGLIWILAIGNLSQVCRNDPETHSVLPLFASWPGCATYVFSDAWKVFLHHSGSAGVTCGTVWRTRGGDRSQARRSHV